ncbi:MAG: hypothetical protein JNL39_17305, partial [Opitutaceae bacterium]|nr:hypothetical protein [Opitutaceae bacterium]
MPPVLCGFAPRLLLLCFLAAAGLRAQPLDTNFTPNTSAEVFALAAQPDGKILAGGNFTTMGGVARAYIARLNADGSVDASFNPGASTSVQSLAIQPDGKIVAGGSFTTMANVTRVRLARLNPDGTLDPTFTAGADAAVFALAVQPDGKIIVGGLFAFVNDVPRNLLARVNSNGTLDTAFAPVFTGTTVGAQARIDAVAVQRDGKIVVGGNFGQINGTARSGLARLNADGTLDTTFPVGTGANSNVFAIVIQPDEKILIGGTFTTFAGQPRRSIARFSPTGVLDNVGTIGPGATVRGILLLPDGSFIAGGTFNTVGSVARNRLARFRADGSFDPAFDPDVTGAVGQSSPGVYAMVSPGPDQVVFGGAFSAVSGQPRSGLARLGTPLPLITRQPADLAAFAGASVTLSVASNVTTGAQYQWRRNGTPVAGATAATLTLGNFQAAEAGAYTVAITNAFGTTTSTPATLTLGAAPNAATLALAAGPTQQHAQAGARATLTASASGTGVTYQWRKDGVPLAAATTATYTIPAATGADMGYYTIVVSSGGSSIESAEAILTVATPGVEGRLINVSTRGFVPAGGSLTPGFVLSGGGTKRLLVRGVGPTLARFGLAGALADPRLELVPLGSLAPLASNDDWVASAALSSTSTAVGAFALDAASRDSALLTDLPAAGT